MSLIFQILYTFITVYIYMMFARAISSWFVRDLSNPIVRFLHEVTEPLLTPIRNLLQRLNIGGGMIDFSFIIAYLLLIMIQELLRGFMF